MRAETGGNAAEIPGEQKWSLIVVWGRESSSRLASAHFGSTGNMSGKGLEDDYQIDSGCFDRVESRPL